MDQEAYNVRFARWDALIREANSAGIPKIEWCRNHNISENQFYYWQRRVRARAVAEMQTNAVTSSGLMRSEQTPSLVELRAPVSEPSVIEAASLSNDHNAQTNHTADLLLRVGAYEIQVSGPATEETLRMVLRVLGNA